jgi:hypothetical protein
MDSQTPLEHVEDQKELDSLIDQWERIVKSTKQEVLTATSEQVKKIAQGRLTFFEATLKHLRGAKQ